MLKWLAHGCQEGLGFPKRMLTKCIAKLRSKSSLCFFLDVQQFDTIAVIPVFHLESKTTYSSDYLDFQSKFVTLHSCSLYFYPLFRWNPSL